eukprot:TRINITY_DN7894_c0_g1_i1.p1 TRINITY_DN7894_c0_g1~~TRINITY_DN7894_c0_g1_i1.p1  ORF type:complete len:326 (-),score=66.92 TRINITY_DN7894_c0_g1_i1:143-1048(-)
MKEESDAPIPMAVVVALTQAITLSQATTMLHLNKDLTAAIEALQLVHESIMMRSSCELFKRYVTRTWTDLQNFQLLKQKLLARGKQFKANAASSSASIAKTAHSFIRDGMVILTHGFSSVVAAILRAALRRKRRFTVYLTESRPGADAARMAALLLKYDVPVTIIADSHVGYVMGKIDMVLVGAVAVVENGGLLNKIGTYQLAIIAKALKKPVYAAAQSFIFTRLYPLNQADIPANDAHADDAGHAQDAEPAMAQLYNNSTLEWESVKLDYTPPSYLTLLFTDLGLLTPSAVSDELIKLYS